MRYRGPHLCPALHGGQGQEYIQERAHDLALCNMLWGAELVCNYFGQGTAKIPLRTSLDLLRNSVYTELSSLSQVLW